MSLLLRCVGWLVYFILFALSACDGRRYGGKLW